MLGKQQTARDCANQAHTQTHKSRENTTVKDSHFIPSSLNQYLYEQNRNMLQTSRADHFLLFFCKERTKMAAP